MKKVVSTVVLVLCMSSPAFAKAPSHHNTDIDQKQGQLQGQLQGQAQGQIGINEQGQTAVGEVDIDNPAEKTLYKGALSQDVPEGNEGPMAVTPWGGAAITRQAEMTRIVSAYNLLPQEDPRRSILVDQAVEAAKPCRWLGFGPKRFSILGGLECWTDLRQSKKK